MILFSFVTGPLEQTFSNLILDVDLIITRDFLFFSSLFYSKWKFNPQKGHFWSFWLILALARYSWRVGKSVQSRAFFFSFWLTEFFEKSFPKIALLWNILTVICLSNIWCSFKLSLPVRKRPRFLYLVRVKGCLKLGNQSSFDCLSLLRTTFSLETLVAKTKEKERILINSKTRQWPSSFVQKIHIQKCNVFCVNT